MKKLLLLLITLFSISIAYFYNEDYNNILFMTYFAYQDHVALIEDKEYIPLSLSFSCDNEEMKEFYQDLIDEYQDQYTFLFTYENYDQGKENYYFSLFTKNDQLIEDLRQRGAKSIQFDSFNSQGYYTSDLADKQAVDYIEILDNYAFNKVNRQIYITSLFDSLSYLQNNDLDYITLWVYYDDIDFEAEFQRFLSDNGWLDKVSYLNIKDIYHNAQIEMFEDNSLNEIIYFIIFLMIIYVLILLTYLSKKKKEIFIQKIHGISYLKICFQNIIKILCLHIVVFSILFIGSLYVLSGYQLFHQQQLLINSLSFVLYFIIGLLSVFIIVFLILKYFISVKTIKSSTNGNKNIYLMMFIKIMVFIMISSSFIETVKQTITNYQQYYYINHHYDTVSRMYYIDGDLNQNIEDDIFDYYQDYGGIYCDFETYNNNTIDSLMLLWPDIDRDDLMEQAFDFPVIYVNANYLKEMNQDIVLSDGTTVDLDNLEEDTLFVPSAYMHKNIDNALAYGTSKYQVTTATIKNNGTFFNYALKEPYTLTNPAVYVLTEYHAGCYNYYLFIPDGSYVLKRVDENVTLISKQQRLDNQVLNNIEELKRSIFTTSLYLCIYISVLYLFVFWFIEGFKKELMIKYLFGKTKKERYQILYLYNSLVFIAPLIYNVLKGVSFIDLMILYSLSIIFEIILTTYFILRMEKSSVSIILKGENQL